MQRHSQERRKQIVVNAPLQGRLVVNMAMLPALALAGIAIFTGVYVRNVMEEAIATDTELPNLMPLFYLVIVFELLAAVFLMVNSLKISHKVAGPAYRICKSLERIRGGDIAFEVKLRNGDHLTEIRDEMNRLLDWLNANPPAGCTTRAMAASASPAAAGPQQDVTADASSRGTGASREDGAVETTAAVAGGETGTPPAHG